jgi:hypothetical protein
MEVVLPLKVNKAMEPCVRGHNNWWTGGQHGRVCRDCDRISHAKHYLARGEYRREKQRHLRMEILLSYGGMCACCGEKRYEFLGIDHINGNGAQHRRDNNLKGGTSFYKWLIKNNYPEGFRVLCHNCNFSRGHLGYCPCGDGSYGSLGAFEG